MAGRAARGQPRDLPRRRASEPRRRLVARALRRRRGYRRGEGSGMMLLTPDRHAALCANAAAHRNAIRLGADEPDPVPAAKFFNPLAAATWLPRELSPYADTTFGLTHL